MKQASRSGIQPKQNISRIMASSGADCGIFLHDLLYTLPRADHVGRGHDYIRVVFQLSYGRPDSPLRGTIFAGISFAVIIARIRLENFVTLRRSTPHQSDTHTIGI